MSEKDLGKALLQLNALELAGVPDVRQRTWNVLDRDRRRVRLLMWLTIILWLLAAAWVMFILVAFGLLLPMQAKLLQDAERDKAEQRFAKEPEKAEAAARLREPMMMHMILQKLVVNVTLAVAVLTMAALATLFLVLASRRATLRQVNASLLEISEQLRLLRKAPGEPGP